MVTQSIIVPIIVMFFSLTVFEGVIHVFVITLAMIREGLRFD